MDGLLKLNYQYPQGCPHCRVMVLGRVLHDGIFGTLNFRFEFKTANQPGFEPGSPGLKAARLAIKLHSIDFSENILSGLVIPSHLLT